MLPRRKPSFIPHRLYSSSFAYLGNRPVLTRKLTAGDCCIDLCLGLLLQPGKRKTSCVVDETNGDDRQVRPYRYNICVIQHSYKRAFVRTVCLSCDVAPVSFLTCNPFKRTCSKSTVPSQSTTLLSRCRPFSLFSPLPPRSPPMPHGRNFGSALKTRLELVSALFRTILPSSV